MKILGLIGGTSWVSTVEYYSKINHIVNQRLGGLNSAECLVYSLNLQKVKDFNDSGNWDATAQMIINAARKLESSGAKAILLCANTLHHVADQVQAQLTIPILHIAEVTAKVIHAQGLSKVCLLGTKFTMEYDFFKDKLRAKGIETIIPSEEDRQFIHHSIFEELGKGIFTDDTKSQYLSIVQKLEAAGAQGIIAGCSEIPLLIGSSDIALPYFDTTEIHCNSAIDFIFGCTYSN